MKTLLIASILTALVALPAVADENTRPSGIRYKPASIITITDCLVAGSDNDTIPFGRYEVCAFDEDVYICAAATCAAAGYRLASGTCRYWRFQSTAIHSCRSAGSVGDVQFTPYAP